MKKKIILAGAFLCACFAFDKVDAQDFVDNGESFATNGKTANETTRVRRGETKNLIGYISLLPKGEAVSRPEVRTLAKDLDYLLEKISNEFEKTCDPSNRFLYSSDTLFIDADSLVLSKNTVKEDENGGKVMTIETAIYDGENSSFLTRTVQTKSPVERTTQAFLELINLENTDNTASGDNTETKSKSDRSFSTGLVWGYGYANWAEGDFFSTPASSDSYNLKWSNRWDIMFRFTLFPDKPVSLTSGVGYQSNIFNFDFEQGNQPSGGISIPVDITPDKYKLVARYITVPLIANFRLAKRVYLHAGVIGGLNYRNSHTGFKVVYSENGEKKECHTGSGFKQFNTFKAEALFGIEFGGWTFYASHSLTDIFEYSYGKNLKPFSFGIMLDL